MNKAKIEKTLREGDGSLAFAYFSVLLPILKLGKEGQDKKLHFCSESHSIMSDSLGPHGLYSSWNSPGQNTGVGSLSLLQWIFLAQESNWRLLHCRGILYQLSYLRKELKNSLTGMIFTERLNVVFYIIIWYIVNRSTYS